MLLKHKQTTIQFIQFGIVGSSGFILDTSTVYLLRSVIGLSTATLIAYFIAATSNWFINRLWTFKQSTQNNQPFLLQWIKFLSTNSLGFFLNRGTVFILFFISPTCKIHPIIALLAGAIAGMFANFHLSRKLVYTNLFNKNKKF